MPIRVKCGSCGHLFQIGEGHAGKRVRFKCPGCKEAQVALIPQDDRGVQVVSQADVPLFQDDDFTPEPGLGPAGAGPPPPPEAVPERPGTRSQLALR